MFDCCGKDGKSLCEQLTCSVEETAKGVRVEIRAKDEAKTDALKGMLKAVRNFCGCC